MIGTLPVPQLAHIVGPPTARQRYAIEIRHSMAYRWWAFGGPLLCASWDVQRVLYTCLVHYTLNTFLVPYANVEYVWCKLRIRWKYGSCRLEIRYTYAT